jgi:hypothetical protein
MQLPMRPASRPLLVSLAWLVFSFTSGCTNTALTNDGGQIASGCRYPSACYSLSCACTQASLAGECKVCDPATAPASAPCDCKAFDAGYACLEPSQVCVGRAPTVCAGTGARCLPAGATCDTSGGVPPQRVSVVRATGPTVEAHCALVDDVCCMGPAPEDLGMPIDANLDQAKRD